MQASKKTAAEHLKQAVDHVLSLWEERVRKHLLAAHREGSPLLRNSLPRFLEQLIEALHFREDKQKIKGEIKSTSQSHGEERAARGDYSLNEILQEYHVLQKTIFEVLESDTRLTTAERDSILESIHLGMSRAAAEFSRVQTDALSRAHKYEERIKLHYQELLDSLDHAIAWEADPATLRLKLVGKTAETLLGYPIEAWLGDPEFLSRHLYSEDRDRVLDSLRQSGAKGAAARLEHRMIAKDGRVLWFLSGFRPEFDEQSRIALVRGLSVEITPYKELREQVEISNNWLSALMSSSPIGLVILDPDLRYVRVNPALAAINGCPVEEHIGQSARDIIPEAAGVIETILEEVRRTKRPVTNFEASAVPPTDPGRVHHYLISYYPILDHERTLSGFGGALVDITERKEAELVVKSDRSKLETIFRESPVAMAILRGPEQVYELVNPAYQAIWGRRDLIGKPLLEVLPEMREQPFPALIQKVYETGEPFTGTEMPVKVRRSPNGPPEQRYFDVHYSRINDAEGNPYAVYVYATDVTERVNSKQELELTIRNLQQEREVRERFVAALSHDLRHPLSTAKMTAQILIHRPQLQPEEHLLERIVTTMSRADHMIQDLLDATSLQAGHKIPLKFDVCMLDELLETTVTDLRVLHGDRFVVSGETGIVGVWSVEEIRRAIENLANNAVKYGAPKAPVTIHRSRHNDYIWISVHNEGAEISPEDQKTIFEPFNRTRTAEASGKKGWGIGLVLVRAIAEAHSGSVRVESEPGKGTTFTLELPKFLSLQTPESRT